jgi:hypothetical protein
MGTSEDKIKVDLNKYEMRGLFVSTVVNLSVSKKARNFVISLSGGYKERLQLLLSSV